VLVVMVMVMGVDFGAVVVVMRVFVVVMLMVAMLAMFVFMGLMGLMFAFVVVMLVFAMFVMLVGVRMAVLVLVMVVALVPFLFILVVGVGGALVDAKFHAFQMVPLLALEVHVEVAEFELGELPLEGGGFHAEIDEGADGHVAGDAGKAIEEEDFHGNGAEGWMEARCWMKWNATQRDRAG
jgi:hypothetical protein